MISIKNLSFSYKDDDQRALKDVSLTIKAGEFVGIIGPSGAGKSTLTMALNGIVPHFYNKGAFYGEVKILNQDTVEMDCEVLAQNIGSVLQDPDAQMITENVEDEIAFALENRALAPELIEERITESLELCGISYLRKRLISELSGGQRQRVAIAAAIAQQPKILVLDEPTSELDPQGSELVFETLKMLNQKLGMTIIIVEQKVMLLSAYCSRMIVMQAGKIALDGETRSVLESYKQLEDMGVNCPRIVTVAALLRKAQLYNGTLPINVAEACKMLETI